MNGVHVSAPGKVVLCGEYVVLGGAQALSFAVNRRATVQIVSTSGPHSQLVCRGFVDGTYAFNFDKGNGFRWHVDKDKLPDFHLFETIWSTLCTVDSGVVDVVLDTRDFADPKSGKKYGLGSSAALTVALSSALHEPRNADEELKTLINIHKETQGGQGSGVDIATAKFGGMISYRAHPQPTVEKIFWPSGLSCALFWSGRSASTSEKLHKFAAGRAASKSHRKLASSSNEIVANWQNYQPRKLLRALAEYTSNLRSFSDDYGLGVFDAGHDEMVSAAADHGIVYKPCGAGGGDIGIAMAESQASLVSFREAARAFGFEYLNVEMERTGAQTEGALL